MTAHPIVRLLLSWALLALGVLLSALLVPGISYVNTGALIMVVLILGLLNAVLKPLLVLFTLPFIVLTMGVGMLLINAVLFLLAGRLAPGFEVVGFGSAFLGALITGLVGVVVNTLLPVRFQSIAASVRTKNRKKDDDVIDI